MVYPWAITLESTGDILLLGAPYGPFPTRLYRINPSSGVRTPLFGDILTSAQSSLLVAGVPEFMSFANEPSGNTLVMDFGILFETIRELSGGIGTLWRINRSSGSAWLLSALGRSSEGPKGSIAGLEHTVAVDGAGSVLVPVLWHATMRGAVFRIDPLTGRRAVLAISPIQARAPCSKERSR